MTSTPTYLLIESAKAGKRSAFDELAERYRDRLQRFIRSRLGARMAEVESLEDIQQETWLRAFQSIDRFRWESEESFVHWLGTIADNVIRSLARREQRKPVNLMSDSALDAAQAGADDSQSRQVRKKERFHRLQSCLSHQSGLWHPKFRHFPVVSLLNPPGFVCAQRRGRRRDITPGNAKGAARLRM